MSRHEIVMPQMGESITNGTITKWHKAPGDSIEIDEILFPFLAAAPVLESLRKIRLDDKFHHCIEVLKGKHIDLFDK